MWWQRGINMARSLALGLTVLGVAFGLSAAASAADLGTSGSAPVYTKAPPAVFSWTGFYVGAHAGADWGPVIVRDDAGDGVPPGPFEYKASGAFVGATGGYNFQIGNFLAGIEGDIGYMDLKGAGIIPSSNPAAHQDITLDPGAYGDITARFGYAFNRTLAYVKGGGAFYDGVARQTTTNPGYVTTGTRTFTGWTVGGGVEHFITDKVSIKAEYQHFRFGTEVGYQTNVGDLTSPLGYRFHNWTDLNAETLKAGVNWHF
jgi:outer membrane immunogenic protein